MALGVPAQHHDALHFFCHDDGPLGLCMGGFTLDELLGAAWTVGTKRLLS
jgi:hypothetical protein